MQKVRIGIIGLGNRGIGHARYIAKGEIKNAELSAVCDSNSERLNVANKEFGETVKTFESMEALFKSNCADGVIIATPHFHHPSMAIKAFENNMHVLIEKPAGVYTKQVREMNMKAEKSGKVFAIMYNQRTKPIFQKLRELIKEGELGELRRTNWIATDWYRPQSYYNSGGWRATWSGEGGGVLLNQCPHNLDLWQWTCGMPKRVRAFMYFGKYHDIEVEDDVTAFVEYENGATGVFITTTADFPGTNRLEVTGDRGKIVIENGTLSFWRLWVSEREFNRTFTGQFGEPECWTCEVPLKGKDTAHQGITSDWVNAILSGAPLLSPGLEGINGLEISNAMHLSTWLNDWVDLPVDEDLFYKMLNQRIRK